MIKISFSPYAVHSLCDRCSVIISTNVLRIWSNPTWIKVDSPRRRQSPGDGRIMDFCSDKCRIVFFKGWKYYQRKQNHFLAHLKKLDGN